MKVDGKIIIVTGASSGIGLATARHLAKQGAKIVLVARSEEKLKEIAKNLPDSLVIPTDMTKPQEIQEMVTKVMDHFGRIDILINNAGQGYDAPVEKINIATFHQIFDLDVVGPLVAMQQVIPIMRKQGEGAIINISSGTALMYLPNMSAYSSLKRALVAVSLTAREELKKDNIHVSVVYPYITDTAFEKNTIKEYGENGQLQEEDNNGTFNLPKPDSAEYVAQKILDVITSGDADIFAHDWMKRNN